MRGGDEHRRRHEAAGAVGNRAVPEVGDEQADRRVRAAVERAARDGEGRRRDCKSSDAGRDENVRPDAHYAPLEKP